MARPDAALVSLENAIVAEKRMAQLRVATVDAVLSLAELVQESYVSMQEAVAIIRPGGVFVDDMVKLLDAGRRGGGTHCSARARLGWRSG